MNITVAHHELANAVSICKRGMDSSPFLPVLSYFLFEAEDGLLKITSTNLILSITKWIDADIESEGRIAIPAKVLDEIVRHLKEGDIRIETDHNRCAIKLVCGNYKANIRCIHADDFPTETHGEEGDEAEKFSIPVEDFQHMVTMTSISASNEPARPILTGICIKIEDNLITMASSDGYRLSVCTLETDRLVSPDEVVIPVSSALAISRSFSEGEINFSISGNMLAASSPDLLISTFLMEGRYPAFHTIIPSATPTTARADSETLLKLCQSAEIFSRDIANSVQMIVKNDLNSGVVEVRGKSAEKGENTGVAVADVTGEEVQIKFNVRYLIDLLKATSGNDVILGLVNSHSPMLVTIPHDSSFKHVIMPMGA